MYRAPYVLIWLCPATHLISSPVLSLFSYFSLCYKITPKKETISHTFINLMENIQEYNVGKIM